MNSRTVAAVEKLVLASVEKVSKAADNSSLKRANLMVNNRYFSSYLRVTQRYIEGEVLKTFDIATIIVGNKYSSQGLFRDVILPAIEREAQRIGAIMFIECVQEQRFRDFLLKSGYLSHDRSTPESFYKKLNKQ